MGLSTEKFTTKSSDHPKIGFWDLASGDAKSLKIFFVKVKARILLRMFDTEEHIEHIKTHRTHRDTEHIETHKHTGIRIGH